MKEEKLRIQRSVYPETKISQQQWMQSYGVSTAYVKPTNYYTGNHFEPVEQTNIFNRILKLLNSLS
jgi:hypothetical protein